MKTTIIKTATIAISFLTVGQGGFCQGTFQNLDFESAQIIRLPGGPYVNSIATTNALPGWDVYIGANQRSQITYNNPALGSTFVSIVVTNGSQLAGNVSVSLQGGLTAAAATITQTGLVPASAQSLLFFGAESSSISPGLVVSLGGQPLPFFVMATEPGYDLYGADISAFAGQREALSFSALVAPGGYNNWIIDNILFSDQAIPEPSVFGLSALGASLLGWRAMRRRR